jgi:hypothetical protein
MKVSLPLLVTAVSPESWSPLAKKQPLILFIRPSAAIRKGPIDPVMSIPANGGRHERATDGETNSGCERAGRG